MDRIEIVLIYNASLLLALGIVYEISYLLPSKWKKLTSGINGILIGFICLLVMSFPYEMEQGIVFDTRSIMLSVAAVTFGAVPASIAAAMALVYRIAFIGGPGTLTGVSVIVFSVAIGILWRKRLQVSAPWKQVAYLYLMGLGVHAVMLLCMLFMPDPVRVLKQISLPVMVIYPIGTVLLGILLIRQKQRNEGLFKLAEAESRYKSLFQNNLAVMLLINPENGQILDANPAASLFYGWDHSRLTRMNITEINTLSREELNAEMRLALSQKRNNFQFRHMRASGEVADVEVFSGPISVDGQTLLYSLVQDVSERNKSRKALVESEDRFQQLVEAAPDAIFINKKGRLVFANQAMARLVGAKNVDEIAGTPFVNYVHPQIGRASCRERV
jgi:PAS domain S-box-containing protein